MTRHEVSDGWVELRDPKHVSERNRRPIIAKATSMKALADKIDAEEFNEAEFNALYSFNDLVAVALISSWSWDAPVTVDGLLDLAASDYDAILKLTAPLVSDLMPSFEPDPDNPESPTEPSDA